MEMVDLEPKIDTLKVFVSAGSFLPKQPLIQSLSERPSEFLEFHVYPGRDCNGEIYDDNGQSMGFICGDFLRQKVNCMVDDHGIASITLSEREERFAPWWDDPLCFPCFDTPPCKDEW